LIFFDNGVVDADKWDTDDEEDDDDDLWDDGDTGSSVFGDADSRGRHHRDHEAGDVETDGCSTVQSRTGVHSAADNDDLVDRESVGRGCVDGGHRGARGSAGPADRPGGRGRLTASRGGRTCRGAISSRGSGAPTGRGGGGSGRGGSQRGRCDDVVVGSGMIDCTDSHSVGRTENHNAGSESSGYDCLAEVRVRCENENSRLTGPLNDRDVGSASSADKDHNSRDRDHGVSDGKDDDEGSQSQLDFIRRQRMKWLDAKDHDLRKQSESSETPLSAVQKSVGFTKKTSNHVVNSERHPDTRVATSDVVSCSVVRRKSDAVSSRRATDNETSGERRTAIVEPVVTHHIREDTSRHTGEDSGNKNWTDQNQVRSCSKSKTRSSPVVLGRISGGTANGVRKEEREASAKKSDDVQEHSFTSSSSYCEVSHRQRIESEPQPPQLQRTSDDSDRRSAETQPKQVKLGVQDTTTTAASSLSYSSPCDPGAASNILSDSVELPRTSGDAVSNTPDTVSPGLRDTITQFRNPEKTDGSVSRSSDDFRNSSCTAYSYWDQPLNEDDFDLYMKVDGQEFWCPGSSASKSASAHDFAGVVDPPEDFRDSDDTLVKQPVSSASESVSDVTEKVCFAEDDQTSCQHACELVQSVALNTSKNVESSLSDVTAPAAGSCKQLWTCVYSRGSVAVGEISTRFSPAYFDVKAQNNVVHDMSATTEGIGGKNDLAVDNTACLPPSFLESKPNNKPANETCNKEITQCDHHSSSTNGGLILENCVVIASPRNIHEESSTGVPIENESSSREANITDMLGDSSDDLGSLPTRETDDGLSGVHNDYRVGERSCQIPAEMEADFIDQMRHETCPNVALSSTEDFFSETSLSLIVTHVVDERHFWAQVVNDGQQVLYAVIV